MVTLLPHVKLLPYTAYYSRDTLHTAHMHPLSRVYEKQKIRGVTIKIKVNTMDINSQFYAILMLSQLLSEISIHSKQPWSAPSVRNMQLK